MIYELGERGLFGPECLCKFRAGPSDRGADFTQIGADFAQAEVYLRHSEKKGEVKSPFRLIFPENEKCIERKVQYQNCQGGHWADQPTEPDSSQLPAQVVYTLK